MRSAFAGRVRRLHDLAVRVPQRLSIEFLLDRLVPDLGRLAKAEQVVVQHGAHCRRRNLVKVHFGVVQDPRNRVSNNVDTVIV